MSSKQNACPTVDIGGQAVMEGVMMKGPKAMAITVRRPDKTLVVKYQTVTPLSEKYPWMGLPLIRGAVNMAFMLVSGMQVLNDSTAMLGVLEEEPTKFELWLSEKLGKGIDKIMMGVAMVLAIFLSAGLFIAIPAGAETLMKNAGMPVVAYTLLGGILKIAILMGYMIFCGFVPDVRRTFQYHGAEHKTVYCNENGLPLTPENAQKFTTLHPRCGTAFLLIVFSISILLFLVLNVLMPISNFFVRFAFHLLMLPLVAGISYEVLKGLAHSDSKLAHILRWPGLQLQRLTTRQPDDEMMECAIVSMNAVLYGPPANAPRTEEGWYLLSNYRESEKGYVFPEKAE